MARVISDPRIKAGVKTFSELMTKRPKIKEREHLQAKLILARALPRQKQPLADIKKYQIRIRAIDRMLKQKGINA